MIHYSTNCEIKFVICSINCYICSIITLLLPSNLTTYEKDFIIAILYILSILPICADSRNRNDSRAYVFNRSIFSRTSASNI